MIKLHQNDKTIPWMCYFSDVPCFLVLNLLRHFISWELSAKRQLIQCRVYDLKNKSILTDLASLWGNVAFFWSLSDLPAAIDCEKLEASSPPSRTCLALRAAPRAAEFFVSSWKEEKADWTSRRSSTRSEWQKETYLVCGTHQRVWEWSTEGQN